MNGPVERINKEVVRHLSRLVRWHIGWHRGSSRISTTSLTCPSNDTFAMINAALIQQRLLPKVMAYTMSRKSFPTQCPLPNGGNRTGAELHSPAWTNRTNASSDITSLTGSDYDQVLNIGSALYPFILLTCMVTGATTLDLSFSQNSLRGSTNNPSSNISNWLLSQIF